MARSKWKTPYIDKKLLLDVLKNKKDRIVLRTKSRSSTIIEDFVGLTIEVYTGKSYTRVYIDEKMIGHKLGEFSYTRRLGRIHDQKNRNK